MFTQGFGETITDALTVNPALVYLPAASAILDASNYTFQAVTFGKDAQGFNGFHSHSISSAAETLSSTTGANSYDQGYLGVFNRNASASHFSQVVSSYVEQRTYEVFSATYVSWPNDPSIADTRLERGSTRSSNLSDHQYASALPDLGHYPNAAIDPLFSSVWNKVGGFAPSSSSDYIFYNVSPSGEFQNFSGSITSFFNTSALMDKDGYLTVNSSAIVSESDVKAALSGGAVLVSAEPGHPASAELMMSVVVSGGDAATLAAFGGVKHVGVYCLDMKQMLNSGLLPPYDWNALNNTRKYKLVNKFTFLDSPFYHRDTDSSPLDFSGYKVLSEDGITGVPAFTNGGPTINLIFSFK